jgi:hypothetical protein
MNLSSAIDFAVVFGVTRTRARVMIRLGVTEREDFNGRKVSITRHLWSEDYRGWRMGEGQTKQETTHAVAYAAANHAKWFWGGVYG